MKKHFSIPLPLKVISLIVGSLGLGLFLQAILWKEPHNPNNNSSAEIHQSFKVTVTAGYVSTPTTNVDNFLPTKTKVSPEVLIPTLTPVWMIYDGIDLSNKEVEVLLTMRCNQDIVYFEPFRVVPYSPEVVASGEFLKNFDFSIAWEHLDFYGLCIHSGLAYGKGQLTAYPLQIYLERDVNGLYRSPNCLDTHLQECVINSEMRLHQQSTISVNKIVAAVRVPPSEVDQVSQHAMDLVPYLAETYPDSGFDQMDPPGLLFFFCGQQLIGEIPNLNYDTWTQARFIIGFKPMTAD